MKNELTTITLQQSGHTDIQFEHFGVDNFSDQVLKQFNNLSFEIKPGDLYVSNNQFVGTVISTDGRGNGIIFMAKRNVFHTHTVKLTCKLVKPLTYIKFDIKI